MKFDYHLCLATVIRKISERLEEEKQIRLDLSTVMRIFLIDFLLLIILTIIYFTCFGCFFIMSSWTVQTINLSSEGLANETYPHSMGEYQLAEEEYDRMDASGSLTVYNFYEHTNRSDRFLIYNTLGNIQYRIL